jgi:hypothetical protein
MSCTAARTDKAARKRGARVLRAAGALRRALRVVIAAAGVAAALAVPMPAQAQAVRGEARLSAQPGYARLVLRFQDDVAPDIDVAGAILVIRFKRPVTLPVDELSDAVPDYIGSVRRDPDGMALRMALMQKVRVNTMIAGERVFIDLLPETWSGQPPSLPAEVVKELSERALAAERALRQQKQAEEASKRPPVRVRASVQPTFVRFVFDLPPGVSVSSSLSEDRFVLSFAAPLTFDLADVKIAMPANVRSVDQKIAGDTARVAIGLAGEADVRAFREDKTYVVDIGFEQAQKPQAALTALSPQPAAAEKDNAAPREAAAAIVPPIAEQIAREAAKAPEVKAAPETTKAAAIEPVKPAAAAPKAEAASPVAAKAADASPPPAPVAAPLPPAATSAPAPLVPELKRSSDDVRLTFAFDGPTPAAAFRRSDSIWLVFDTDRAIDAAAIRRDGSFIVADATAFDLPHGRALRIRLNRPQLAALAGNATAWTLILADKGPTPPQPLTAVRNMAEPGRGSVSIALAAPGRLHRISDPDAGDALLVMTAGAPARGFMRRQDFVEFALLESIHGVVVQQTSDDLTSTVLPDSLTLSRPGGLTLSSAIATPERAAATTRPVFDITAWRDLQTGDFMATRNRLMTAAAQAKGPARVTAHTDMARFYLAHGFYPEAKGILDLLLSEMTAGEEDAAALTLHAVASALAGRPDIALADLANPAVAANVDSQLWKAMAYARQEKWVEAREKFKNAELVVTGLPLDLRRPILAAAFRAALEVKDYPGATARDNDLAVIGLAPEQAGPIALLRGRLAEALGREQDALGEFEAAAASPDRPAAVEAELRAIALRQRRGEISDDDALRQLETLAVMWRGDALEVRTLDLLMALYVARGRYAEALAAERTATRMLPNSPSARRMQTEAAALFAQLYNGDKADELPPVEALAMFYEYRDLTPIGRRGDEMIRRLADRLVAIDLLDQASELLQYQVDHRLEGAARAQVASRLAMVYLMNRKPDRAITALRSTRIGDLAGELRQQRLLLEARAQSDIGRHDLALDIISNIAGREAIRLRSDIHWAARHWRESAEQIELLYGERWREFRPLTDAEKGDIIRAAIGYALAEDAIGLARFREKYSAKMDGGDRTAFDLASKPASANSADFARIARMAAGIDTLDGFLRDMKARYPDAIARTKMPPDIKADPAPTGSLPEIKGLRPARAAR